MTPLLETTGDVYADVLVAASASGLATNTPVSGSHSFAEFSIHGPYVAL